MIPSLEDISPTSGLDLDERCALDHFLGLDQSAALRMFRADEGGIELYLGDFVHMGEVGFNYFLPPLTQYIEELADKDFIEEALDTLDYILIRFSDGREFSQEMNELIRLVTNKLQNLPVEIIGIIPARVANTLNL